MPNYVKHFDHTTAPHQNNQPLVTYHPYWQHSHRIKSSEFLLYARGGAVARSIGLNPIINGKLYTSHYDLHFATRADL